MRLGNCTNLAEACAKGSAANRKAGGACAANMLPGVVASFGGQVSRAVVEAAKKVPQRYGKVARTWTAPAASIVPTRRCSPCRDRRRAKGRSPPRSRLLSSYHHT